MAAPFAKVMMSCDYILDFERKWFDDFTGEWPLGNFGSISAR